MNFILASASPRRKLLLKEAGYSFEVVVSNVDESLYSTENITPQEHTKILALAKAVAVARKHPGQLVMAADTVVDCDGKIIGKPADAEHAEEITRMLFSRPHEVVTGVAMIKPADGIKLVEAATTVIYPRKLTEAQIADHIKNGQWQGKAGAYGIQETGDEFVKKIEGSFTNVIGLPMELVEKMFKEL
mgnify:CR=1 FL=1